jgi:Fe-S cluster assembly protein SufD
MPYVSLDQAAALPGPEWLRDLRTGAARSFLGGVLPTEALEEWRYSRIDSLDLPAYPPAPHPSGEGHRPLGDRALSLLSALGPGASVLETLNGHVLDLTRAVPGVSVDVLSAPGAVPAPLGELCADSDAFAALNLALAPDPVRVRVESPVGVPIVLVHRVAGQETAAYPRVTIEVGRGAEAVVIEMIEGDDAGLVVPVTEIAVAERARLSYLHTQVLGPDAWQIALQSSRVGAGGSLLSAAAALGGSYARLKTESTLAGPGAEGRLLALYFGAGGQMHDFRTVQRHAARRTRSHLLYKGVVANTARSVYSGLIRVEKGAGGSEAFQTNRNLVLHDGAHADSVPNLEIEDNDVRCSHASAVGPVAEDQRFYLESRGVPTTVAERLIALGFLDQVVDELVPSAVALPLRHLIASKLAEAEDAEAARTAAGEGRSADG